MELRPITDLEQWYARELTEAFPPNERKPLADIRALLEAGRYEALGLYDGAALLGYANLWREPAAAGRAPGAAGGADGCPPGHLRPRPHRRGGASGPGRGSAAVSIFVR